MRAGVEGPLSLRKSFVLHYCHPDRARRGGRVEGPACAVPEGTRQLFSRHRGLTPAAKTNVAPAGLFCASVSPRQLRASSHTYSEAVGYLFPSRCAGLGPCRCIESVQSPGVHTGLTIKLRDFIQPFATSGGSCFSNIMRNASNSRSLACRVQHSVENRLVESEWASFGAIVGALRLRPRKPGAASAQDDNS